MGHPVNSIKYVLDNWEYLQKQGFPFYSFILYREQDKTFSDFFESHFELLDALSADACMFFAITPPPTNWNASAGDRAYWRHYMANADQGIAYTSNMVLEAARFFHLEGEHLPAIVIFRNLRHREHIIVRLKGLNSEDLETLFYNLFEFFRSPLSKEMPLWEVRLLIDYLPYERRVSLEQINQWIQRFHSNQKRINSLRRLDDLEGANDRTVRIEGSSSLEDNFRKMQEYLERITGELRDAREENRSQFERIHVQLDRAIAILEGLTERINEVRAPLIERYVLIEEEYEDPFERLVVREKLFEEFDEFLTAQVYQIGKELQKAGSRFVLPSEMLIFDDILEPSSREQLMTAELMWQNSINLPPNFPLDYSVCAIGLWKALECETNRTFVDALRVYNNLATPGHTSIGQQYSKKGNFTEKGIFPPKTVPREIVITENSNGYLRSLMLGSVAGLVDYGQNNSLQSIYQNITHLPLLNNSPLLLFHDVAQDIRMVTNRFRNSYAHLSTMNRTICQEFRNFVFIDRDSNPLYFTLRCKREMLRRGSI